MEESNQLEYTKDKIELNGGISQELVTDSHKSFSADLICSICLEVVRNPKLCKSCQNMFCSDCLTKQLAKSKFCPNRCVYKDQEVNLIFKKLLHKIELKCYYHVNGCPDIVLYENFDKHTENCIYGDYRCLSPGCNFKQTLKEIQIHVKQCPLKLIECQYCINKIYKKDFNSHMEECANKQIKCDYCKKHFTNKVYINHKDECDEYEIVCFECNEHYPRKNKSMHTENLCLRNQVYYWKNKYETVEKEKNDLQQKLNISNSNCLEKFLSSNPPVGINQSNNSHNVILNRLLYPNQQGKLFIIL